MKYSKLILHIPHSSKYILREARKYISLSNSELEVELLKMTDSYTDELFSLASSKVISHVFPVSRLVVDPERFVDDSKEAMSKKGMGVVYTKTSNGEALRKYIPATQRAYLIKKYYEPHHKSLTNNVEKMLYFDSRAIIIDCHSFPDIPLPYESDQYRDRPEICLGTDSFHTPEWLYETLYNAFTNNGFNVAKNQPFSGSLVPIKHFKKYLKVNSIMIEINRSIYMNEESGNRNGDFVRVKNIFSKILNTLIEKCEGEINGCNTFS